MTVLQQKLNSFSEEYFDEINAVLVQIPDSEQLQYSDVGLESVREALKNDSWRDMVFFKRPVMPTPAQGR